MNIFLKRYKEWGIDQSLSLDFKEEQVIRVNTNLISAKKLIQRLEEKKIICQKVEFLHHAYRVRSLFPLASTIEYLLGYFYIQESSAQIPGEILSTLLSGKKYEDIRILDCCAAPGGKTTHISQILRNKGEIIALDSSEERAKKLTYNLERLRCQNVTAFQKDAIEYESKKTFDIVLIDAPCSGNFTQDKNWFEKRDLKGITDRTMLQKALLLHSKKHVAEKGIVIYATCSLEKEENEEMITFAIAHGFKLLDTGLNIGHEGLTQETKLCKRFLPSEGFPGFFIGVLQKK